MYILPITEAEGQRAGTARRLAQPIAGGERRGTVLGTVMEAQKGGGHLSSSMGCSAASYSGHYICPVYSICIRRTVIPKITHGIKVTREASLLHMSPYFIPYFHASRIYSNRGTRVLVPGQVIWKQVVLAKLYIPYQRACDSHYHAFQDMPSLNDNNNG